MEVRAIAKFVRVQPRKVRIIADEVRGKPAVHTVSLLRYHKGKGAEALHQVLVSAMHNAQENHGLSPEQLRIAAITIDEGPRFKRMQARAMGRGNRIIKKTSHITVVVEDYEAPKAVKPHGSKPKPRPTFGAPARKTRRGGKKAEEPVAEEQTPIVAEAAAEPAAEEQAVEPTAVETEFAEAAGNAESGDISGNEAAEGEPKADEEKGAE